jgi:putative salt-induced outer membrane protein YdiY
MKIQTCIIGMMALGLGLAAFGQAATEEKKKSTWDSSAALGLTLTEGNSRTLQINGQIQSNKKWDQNEINLGADGTYGKDRGEKSAESLRGYGQYNRLFSDRLFGYLRVDALHDAIADIEYRVGISPGAGYYFIKKENTSLRGEVGPGVIFEKQGDDSETYMTLRFAERFDHKLNERSKIWQTLEFLPQVDDWENFIINAEIGLETAITKSLSQRTYIQNTYDNQPAPDRRKNDVKLVAAIAYKF